MLGLVIAVAAGAVFGLLHALFAITFRADQIVSGTALNLLAVGITGYLYVDIYGDQGTPDDLPAVPDVHLPIKDVPLIGDIFGQLNLLVWLALAMVLVTWVVVFRTSTGLRLRSVGENPLAAETAGLKVVRTRYLAVMTSGGAGGAGRGVPVDRLPPHLLAEHDRGPRVHRAGGADLRPLATRHGAGRDAAVRVRLRAGAAAAGVLAVGRGALPGAAVRADADRGHRPDRSLDPATCARSPVAAFSNRSGGVESLAA